MDNYIFNTPMGEIGISAANRIMAYILFEEMYPELTSESDIVRIER